MEVSKLEWPSRFDHYISLQENSVNWLTLMITMPLTILLTLVIGLILKSTLNKDSEVLEFLRRSYR